MSNTWYWQISWLNFWRCFICWESADEFQDLPVGRCVGEQPTCQQLIFISATVWGLLPLFSDSGPSVWIVLLAPKSSVFSVLGILVWIYGRLTFSLGSPRWWQGRNVEFSLFSRNRWLAWIIGSIWFFPVSWETQYVYYAIDNLCRKIFHVLIVLFLISQIIVGDREGNELEATLNALFGWIGG